MIVSLIGYRGCGKSSVGPLLADMLGCDCVDSDDRIESAAGKSIARIFEEDGEPAFRQLETSVLDQLLKQTSGVIASGGGAILAEINRTNMKSAGPVVWLHASAEALASRIGGDQTSTARRPSLTGKSIQEEVADVLNARSPLYEECATIQVETEGRLPIDIAVEIFQQIRQATEPGDRR
ncbi:MAG: shikimate kinase [Fuerstiella sp.]